MHLERILHRPNNLQPGQTDSRAPGGKRADRKSTWFSTVFFYTGALCKRTPRTTGRNKFQDHRKNKKQIRSRNSGSHTDKHAQTLTKQTAATWIPINFVILYIIIMYFILLSHFCILCCYIFATSCPFLLISVTSLSHHWLSHEPLTMSRI